MPGIKAKGKFTSSRFEYLDDPTMNTQLVQFSSEKQANVLFSLPQMHCSSCVFLLENLHKIDPGIIVSRTNFQRKEIFISYNPALISLRKVVELLAFIGYEPLISLNEAEQKADEPAKKKTISAGRKKIYHIGVAGFCFANIMMLSFPEYFSSGHVNEPGLKTIFNWLNLALSLPVLFFSASPIFISGWKGLRQRYVNIDLPIALAIIVTFSRSYYEIISGHGAGFLDSGTGIVFFMLVGRWFQDKTYDSLSFDRDYRSFLPLGVTVINGKKETNIPVTKLKKGDHIMVRNGEMIPADAILIKGNANIDYSFVSGENIPVQKTAGNLVHAGGRQSGNAIELEIIKDVSHSYLTELWNNDIFHINKNRKESFIHPWSRYFTIALLSIAFFTMIFWLIKNPANIIPATTAVLIVACPCSLLLSATFTYGNMLRIFGKNKLYLKNANVIETLALVDTIIFDKTGTITEPRQSIVDYTGTPLNHFEKIMLNNISKQSTHPLSKIISGHLDVQYHAPLDVKEFEEFAGQGISAFIDGIPVKMGSAGFIGNLNVNASHPGSASHIYVKIGNEIKGSFSIKNHYRNGIRRGIAALKKHGYKMHVLSGDNSSEKENLQTIFGSGCKIKFAQTPIEKLEYIKVLQKGNRKVLMIGDGINDSGALRQADAGISINNNDAQFTPACDAILAGEKLAKLNGFLQYAKAGKKIVQASFVLSIIYNVVGLSFATSAHLRPMVAAILMPVSSISIVLFVTLLSNVSAKRNGL